MRLGRFADRDARQLSGGQQQRVALARAIVFHPPVVLMDEPLGALDKNLRFEMQVEIKEIQQRLGMTVLYVTHDQEEAMSMSDRIAIMDHGRIHQVGSPGEVYERPANPFVGRFLGEANLIEGTVMAGAGDVVRLRLPSGQELCAPRSLGCGTGRGMLFIRPERVEIAPGTSRIRRPQGQHARRKGPPLLVSRQHPALCRGARRRFADHRRSAERCRASRHCPSVRRWCCAGRWQTA